jgi:hypothetical protein
VVARRGGVVVRRTGEHLEMWLERGLRRTLQGRVRRDDPRVSGLAYTDGFLMFPPPAGGAVLFVGLGAGIGPRQVAELHPDVEVAVVESDATVAELAAEHFGVTARATIADGREHRDDRRYDLIVVDAFGAGTYPARLASVEAFAMWRDRLREPGTLVVNLGGTLERVAPVVAALREAFGQVAAFGVPREDGTPYDPRRRGNVLAFGFRGERPAARGPAPRLPRLAAIASCPIDPPRVEPLRDADARGDLPIA